jgi:hypothetical protein
MRERGSKYRWVATTRDGFVQQLCCYVGKGYYFYVTGVIPDGKEARHVDEKLLERYDVRLSKWARSYRKAQGRANIQYLRHGPFFLLIATHGSHRFFEEEAGEVRDIRREPIRYANYQVSAQMGADRRLHSHVRIADEDYKRLKAYLLDVGVHRSREALEGFFFGIPFEPYAPVRRQVWNLVRAVNRERKKASYEPLDWYRCVRMKRRIVRPFEEAGGAPEGRRAVEESKESLGEAA